MHRPLPKPSTALLLAILLGFAPGAALGIGRFAYGLVLPTMQQSLGWSYAQAGLLGSANTAGYLIGALISHRVLYQSGYRRGVLIALLIQTLLIAGLGLSDIFAVLVILRFVQGFLGALVFVGGAAIMLASGGRGLGLGLYFSGVGLGIFISPAVLIVADSWQAMWFWLGGFSLLLTGLSWLALPTLLEPAPPAFTQGNRLRQITLLLISYGFYGAGYIGYMTFVTTALSVPLLPFWLVLGLGATLTGWFWGHWTDRVGGFRALAHVLAVLTFASLYPVLFALPWLSALLFGISFLGVITAITDVFRHTLPESAWARAMGLSTAAFALGQAVGPSISGAAGDWLGGAWGTLGIASLLLACALILAVVSQSSKSPIHP